MKNITYTKSNDTRNKLLAATTKLIQQYPYKNITIRDICTEAGVSSGGFYYHFSSKEDLVQSTFSPLDDKTVILLNHKCNALPPIEGLNHLFQQYVIILSDQKKRALTLEYVKLLLDSIRTISMEKEHPFYNLIYCQLKRCEELNLLEPKFDCNRLTLYSLQFLRGFIFDWLIHEYPVDVNQKFEECFHLYLKSILR